MTQSPPEKAKMNIRPLIYRDLDELENLVTTDWEGEQTKDTVPFGQKLEQLRQWYGLLKILSWFPNPWQNHLSIYIAQEQGAGHSNRIKGLIQISPFNSSRSTWRVERILFGRNGGELVLITDPQGAASQLLRHCFETIWEARTWVLEVSIHEKNNLALYRQHGFQPLAKITYWHLAPELLKKLAQHEPDLPNLLPVSNSDAQLLYQLDCVSMPPLMRQVFDRHILDFKTDIFRAIFTRVQQWFTNTEKKQGYVFEPQRKAAIGYFKLTLSQGGNSPHKGQLTVHPAYTWLYPQLLSQMARIAQKYPSQPLELISADYQHEREEYLEQLGAQRVEHTLLMSRSVWHKLRETKKEGIQLAEMLQGLQNVSRRSPIPTPWLELPSHLPHKTSSQKDICPPNNNGEKSPDLPENQDKGENL